MRRKGDQLDTFPKAAAHRALHLALGAVYTRRAALSAPRPAEGGDTRRAQHRRVDGSRRLRYGRQRDVPAGDRRAAGGVDAQAQRGLARPNHEPQRGQSLGARRERGGAPGSGRADTRGRHRHRTHGRRNTGGRRGLRRGRDGKSGVAYR